MISWISVNEKLPEDHKLVWIFVTYDPSPYDNVTERTSIGYHCYDRWHDVLDFPFVDDFMVTHWQEMMFPEKPNS